MKYLSVLSFLLVVTLSCSNQKNNRRELIDFVTPNTELIIKTSNFDAFKSSLTNNELLKQLSAYKTIDSLQKELKILQAINTSGEALITFKTPTKDSLHFLLLTQNHKALFMADSLPHHSIETLRYKNRTITKTTLEGQALFSTLIDSIFIASNSLSAMKAVAPNKTTDSELNKLYHTTENNSTFSWLRVAPHKHNFPALLLTDSLSNLRFGNYIMLDVNLTQNALIANGLVKSTDSAKSLINVFNKTVAQENKISKACPATVSSFLSLTFNDFKVFNKNLKAFTKKDSLQTAAFFDTTNEIGLITQDAQQALFFNVLDQTAALEQLASVTTVAHFRNININTFESASIFNASLSPFITEKTPDYFIALDDFLVFSTSIEFLKEIITNYQNGTTLYNNQAFSNLMEHLSDEASLFIYSNASTLNKNLNNYFSQTQPLSLEAYKANAVQYIYDSEFAHVNAAFIKHKSKAVYNTVQEDFTVHLDNALLTNPQVVNNHTNNQKDIVVQDIKNNLYLISNNGKIYWKKQLEGSILGRIEQIDIYKNGRLQLVFTTPHRLYVLDREGNDVGPFPIKFNDEITQPLSVFDYDNKQQYRFLVTQGQSLLMYDKQGKLVKGFLYKKAPNTINTQPQHFRIGRKDYIVFTQGKQLEILNRTGNTRVKVKTPINFSDNNVYLYNNKFTTTTNKGILVQIDATGTFSSANLNLNDLHKLTTTSKTLVTLSENKLNIKSNAVTLDYGTYTAPEIFYINNKIYVATTNLQSNKVYLFDSQANPISNFPIYGNSAIALDNIDKDSALEVVTRGDDKQLIIYKIN